MLYQKVILLITVLGLYISNAHLEKLGSNNTRDSLKISGTWYVGSASISDPRDRDIQFWKIVFSEASPGIYSGNSTEIRRSTCEIETERFNIRVSKRDGRLYGFVLYETAPDGHSEYNGTFEIIGNAIVMTPNDNRNMPYKYLVLGRDLQSAQHVPQPYTLDPDFFFIEYTKCRPAVHKGNASSLYAASMLFLFSFLFCFFPSTYI